jgi:hypoxanthine-DNA glycosylase
VNSLLQGLPPLLDTQTRIVILGSFPGVRSLQIQQYYAHPQNQFWKLVFNVISDATAIKYYPESYEYNSKLILQHGIGLWDVYTACERKGSLDSAIKHAQCNDFTSLRSCCPQLQAIAHNGGESYQHAKHTMTLGLPVHKLPSSSAAHASWSFERKLTVWRDVLRPFLT